MKYFLITLFCSSTLFCQGNECEVQRKRLLANIQCHMNRIHYCIGLYECENKEITCPLDYYKGYLEGELQAYTEVKASLENTLIH